LPSSTNMYDLLKEHNPRILKTGEMLLDWHWPGPPRNYNVGKNKGCLPAPDQNIAQTSKTTEIIGDLRPRVKSKQDIMRTMGAKKLIGIW